MVSLFSSDSMKKLPGTGERIVSGMNTIIHCHHYNSRIQATIEGASMVNGESIFRDAAEQTFTKIFEKQKIEFGERVDMYQIGSDLFRFLGFGLLDFSCSSEQKVISSSSHFVQGWKCGHKKSFQKTCPFVEG